MGRKKAQEAQQEYTYEEVHNSNLDDMTKIDDTEKVESDAVVEEKEPEKEPEKEEPKEEEKDYEEVEFDPEKLKAEAAEEATKKIWEQAEQKRQEMEEEERLARLREDENTPPWVKRGDKTPKDYDELISWNKEVAKREILAEIEEREKSRQEKAEEEKKQKETEQADEEEKRKAFNAVLDEELEELTSNGKLPKIIDPNDKNDPGVKARKGLFSTMRDVNEKLGKEGKPLIYSLSRIYTNYYKPKDALSDCANAPISGAKIRSAAQQQKGEYTYWQIHNAKDIRDLY